MSKFLSFTAKFAVIFMAVIPLFELIQTGGIVTVLACACIAINSVIIFIMAFVALLNEWFDLFG